MRGAETETIKNLGIGVGGLMVGIVMMKQQRNAIKTFRQIHRGGTTLSVASAKITKKENNKLN
jgi:hypothetical protein